MLAKIRDLIEYATVDDQVTHQILEKVADAGVGCPLVQSRLQLVVEGRVEIVQVRDTEKEGVEVLRRHDGLRRSDRRFERLHVLFESFRQFGGDSRAHYIAPNELESLSL